MVIESPLHSQKRILVVEDDNAMRTMLVQLMQSCNYEVFEESDGDKVYQKVLDLRPDMLLLDLNLPGTNGLVISGKIKSDSRIKDIPILMMTGEFRRIDDKLKGFTAGADDYILKPVDISILVARVQAMLKK